MLYILAFLFGFETLEDPTILLGHAVVGIRAPDHTLQGLHHIAGAHG